MTTSVKNDAEFLGWIADKYIRVILELLKFIDKIIKLHCDSLIFKPSYYSYIHLVHSFLMDMMIVYHDIFKFYKF